MTRFNLMVSAGALALGLSATPAFAGGGHGYAPDLLPQHAQPGQCYARVKSGAEYATKSEIVVVHEGYQNFQVSQAHLRNARQSVKVKDESVRYVVRQPQYRSITERVMTSPAYDRLSVSAPRFQTVTETMQLSGPRTVWKKGNPGRLAAQGYNVLSTANGGYGTSAGAGNTGRHEGSTTNYASTGAAQCGPTCEIWCLVEEPGESVSYQRKVMTDPARVVRTPVAPQFVTVNKQVLSDPGGVDTVAVPAQYRDIDVKELISAGSVRSVDIAPKMGEVKSKVLVKPESHSWARVICNTGQVVGHSGAVNYPAASRHGSAGHTSGHSQGSHGQAGQTYSGQAVQAATGHSGITYGGHTSSSYSAKQPSALIYGSSNTSAPDYGTSYNSSSQPRIYGGEGMNAHHSAQP